MLETLMIPGGRFMQNAWLLWDSDTLEAVMVDPGEEVERLLAAIRHRQLNVQQIWLTHAHLDHIWGVTDARRATGAPVFLHPADRRWYDAFARQGQMFGIDGLIQPAPPDAELAAGQQLRVGQATFEVRHLPGHSPGSVAFIGEGLAISGDLLFEDAVGRTDIAGGNHQELLESIRSGLLTLPDATRVLPGHGGETTIGRERQFNPWLQV